MKADGAAAKFLVLGLASTALAAFLRLKSPKAESPSAPTTAHAASASAASVATRESTIPPTLAPASGEDERTPAPLDEAPNAPDEPAEVQASPSGDQNVQLPVPDGSVQNVTLTKLLLAPFPDPIGLRLELDLKIPTPEKRPSFERVWDPVMWFGDGAASPPEDELHRGEKSWKDWYQKNLALRSPGKDGLPLLGASYVGRRDGYTGGKRFAFVLVPDFVSYLEIWKNKDGSVVPGSVCLGNDALARYRDSTIPDARPNVTLRYDRSFFLPSPGLGNFPMRTERLDFGSLLTKAVRANPQLPLDGALWRQVVSSFLPENLAKVGFRERIVLSETSRCYRIPFRNESPTGYK